MKQAYPVIITKDKDFFVASIPDFETGTQGESLAEAIEMARDAIGMCGCYMQDEKRIFRYLPISEMSQKKRRIFLHWLM